MSKQRKPGDIFTSAELDRVRMREFETKGKNGSQAQLDSNSYKLVYDDTEFLLRHDMRAVRLQLEYLKPDLILSENDIDSTVVVFGSARIRDPEEIQHQIKQLSIELDQDPDNVSLQRNLAKIRSQEKRSSYYVQARNLTKLITTESEKNGALALHVVTGGGPGIMEAANRGAADAGGKSVGHNIVLPHEQFPNKFITPELCFNFHYFAMRKMHLLVRARAVVVFPGGYGTLDELFETLTLVQTEKIRRIPIVIFGKEYWDRVINFEVMLEEGMVAEADLEMFQFVETAEQAWRIIEQGRDV